MPEHRSIVSARDASRSPSIGDGAVAVGVAVAALVLVPLAGCGGSGGDRLSGELPSAAAAPNQSGPASRNAHGK
jgi:hypothetical protein